MFVMPGGYPDWDLKNPERSWASLNQSRIWEIEAMPDGGWGSRTSIRRSADRRRALSHTFPA